MLLRLALNSRSSCLNIASCWDYKHIPLCLATVRYFQYDIGLSHVIHFFIRNFNGLWHSRSFSFVDSTTLFSLFYTDYAMTALFSIPYICHLHITALFLLSLPKSWSILPIFSRSSFRFCFVLFFWYLVQ